jgi:hypothetical protein
MSEQEKGWQPIATAPKDADVLSLYSTGEGVHPGYWAGDCWVGVETQSLTSGQIKPTHWMPLPEPPPDA